MDYKTKLTAALKQHFVEELGDRDIQISEDLSKFLIPTLLSCVEKALDKSLVDMKKYVVEEDTSYSKTNEPRGTFVGTPPESSLPVLPNLNVESIKNLRGIKDLSGNIEFKDEEE